MVLWLLGFSGAGKTTIGKKLREYFVQNGKDAVLIDGDEVRKFFDSDLGYTTKERKENIKRIQLAAFYLGKTATIAIVCNISPFEKLRDFNREKLGDYVQIYLKNEIEVCKKNDVKDVYQNNIGLTEIVGQDIVFEEPQNNDLVCFTHKESIDESFNKIIDFLDDKYPELINEYSV